LKVFKTKLELYDLTQPLKCCHNCGINTDQYITTWKCDFAPIDFHICLVCIKYHYRFVESPLKKNAEVNFDEN
jgi:hypothetical protein